MDVGHSQEVTSHSNRNGHFFLDQGGGGSWDVNGVFTFFHWSSRIPIGLKSHTESVKVFIGVPVE